MGTTRQCRGICQEQSPSAHPPRVNIANESLEYQPFIVKILEAIYLSNASKVLLYVYSTPRYAL